MGEDGMDSGSIDAAKHRSVDERRIGLALKDNPQRGTAMAVADVLRTAHINASRERGYSWDSSEGVRQRELVSQLHIERRILEKATEAILERKLAEAQSKGEIVRKIEPDIRRNYKKKISASEAMDEVKNILDPMEETLAKNPQAVSREYNIWLDPIDVTEINRISEIGGDLKMRYQLRDEQEVPLAELVKAGRSLMTRLDQEAVRK